MADDRLLTPGEVANIFRVSPKTVSRWQIAGRISAIRTPGGHRRFRESEVRAIVRGGKEEQDNVSVAQAASDEASTDDASGG